jgi:hypothetical protein
MDTDQTQDTVTVSVTAAVDGHGDAYTVDLGNMDDTMFDSSITIAGSPYIFGNHAITVGDTQPSGKLTLTGDDADIFVNGESVMDTLRAIREQLNILVVDEGMEQEWDELRVLRQQYEAKLAECQEKHKMWSMLKK